ncbi:unnamed protein product [Cercospora beticola]|nr:unnamed protein product [Cercospora beticola]
MKISIIAGIIAYSSTAFASALPDPELEERQLGTTYTCVMNPRGNGYCQINNPPPVDPPPPATLGCHKGHRCTKTGNRCNYMDGKHVPGHSPWYGVCY